MKKILDVLNTYDYVARVMCWGGGVGWGGFTTNTDLHSHGLAVLRRPKNPPSKKDV